MTARRITALVLAAAAVLLPGCAESTAGTPTAAETDSPSATEPGATSESTSSGSGPGDSLANIDPCTLLSDEDKARLGLRKEEQDSIGGARLCGWVAGTGSSVYGLGIGIREKQGLAEVRGADGPPKPVSIGSHDAREARDTSGQTCLVAVGVTDSSRVDVSASGGDVSQMCKTATELAKLVEPKLPRD